MPDALARPARQPEPDPRGEDLPTPALPGSPPPHRGRVLSVRAGARPSTDGCRATEFRRSRRRAARRRGAGASVTVGAALALFAVLVSPGGRLGAGWGPSNGAGPSPPSGGPSVVLGNAIVATATCSDGETTTMEAVPWVSASSNLSTGEITLEIQELIDGDIDGGPTPSPSVTADYVCGAPLQTAWTCWYVVLQNPAGVNIAFFSYSQGWVNLNHPGQSITIVNDSTLVLLSDPSYAGVSFALCVLGDAGGTALYACSEL